MRGLETFNNINNAIKALYVTKGRGIDKIIEKEDGIISKIFSF